MRFFKRKRKYAQFDIDTVFLDSKNMPVFNRSQKEGTIEQTINRKTIGTIIAISFLFLLMMIVKAVHLQVIKGPKLNARAENNRLNEIPLFARRGVIADRNGELLAWNELDNKDINNEDTLEYIPDRLYTDKSGMGHILGYVSYPKKDSNGQYWQSSFSGREGIEKIFDKELAGKNGARLVEVDVAGKILSTNLAQTPTTGDKIILTVDARMQDAMYKSMESLAGRMKYKGGAGVIMDINTGEILTMSSYPEYKSEILSNGRDTETISNYFNDKRSIFLNRVFQGSYAPGSIIKPFVALKALHDGVIKPETSILSTGTLSLPNPYDPANPTIFKDWKAHGYTNMKQAIAVSSDVYFYQVGGGFQNQKGIGISGIIKIAKDFYIGEKTDFLFNGEVTGTVPSPEWKKKFFKGDIWRLGDTYNSAIGQYGWQVTPLQMVRAVGGIATNGKLVKPKITFNENTVTTKVGEDFTIQEYKIIKEGMRMTVTDGTATILNIPEMSIAGKTGTAQTGASNQFINSWIVGYFPYDNPKYAFTVMMEGAPSDANQSASFVIYDFFKTIGRDYPELLKYLSGQE